MLSSDKPAVGLGLWKIAKSQCADTVYDALKAGYRHLDSASDYGNEKEVGEGIAKALKEGICKREELWVTSKLWNTFHAKEHVKLALVKTLEDLGLTYLDSYLIHFPIAQQFVPIETRYPPAWFVDPDVKDSKMSIAAVPLYETWQGMEGVVEEGLVKTIGVCNYNTGLLHDLMAYAKIKPSDLQVELHPHLTQERLVRMAKEYGINVTAFSPLGAAAYYEIDMADRSESLFEVSVIKTCAEKYKKSPAQIVLRWGVQRGCSVVTKSTNPGRLRENINIYDFKLSEDEMKEISSLNRNRRFNDTAQFCEDAFNTFYPIYD